MSKYIGIPFKDHGRSFDGADCWGVVLLWYREEEGIELPNLGGYTDSEDMAAIEAMISEQKPAWKPVEEPKSGDVIVFKIGGTPTHVGVYAGSGYFLHAFRGTDCCLESMRSLRWSSRVEGIYRHE